MTNLLLYWIQEHSPGQWKERYTRIKYSIQDFMAKGLTYFGVCRAISFDMLIAEYLIDLRDRQGKKMSIFRGPVRWKAGLTSSKPARIALGKRVIKLHAWIRKMSMMFILLEIGILLIMPVTVGVITIADLEVQRKRYAMHLSMDLKFMIPVIGEADEKVTFIFDKQSKVCTLNTGRYIPVCMEA